ncbi:peptidyl-prolyl cis-trans isomerase [Bacillus marinisedimentorum]|uniref:peptidyl-prolyl cis-trans isomerase n=1 Tax=Bacillus marinisedimentorum TaxID=1821260 RepID=UPI000872B6F4|nr:peptidyl-prolyl cis-trans isomerase [Bacillus marinisedimentorum]
MKQRGLWVLVTLLAASNLAVGYMWWSGSGSNTVHTAAEETDKSTENDITSAETVAQVGGKSISREAWLEDLVSLYGRERLQELINRKVVRSMAEQEGITISEKVLEQELELLEQMFQNDFGEGPIEGGFPNEEEWRDQVEYALLLEELLTKDVVVSEEELKDYYEGNKDLFTIPAGYKLSHIAVATAEEAEAVTEELKGGSSFDALAMERSTDEFTAAQGGSLGFIPLDSGLVPERYFEAAEGLEEGSISGPLETEDGFAVIKLHRKSDGITYTYEDVKGQIRRQIAMSQIEGDFSPEIFWDEANVSWIYE